MIQPGFFSRQPYEASCSVCNRVGTDISRALGVCRECIIADSESAREYLFKARLAARSAYSTPAVPPATSAGKLCRLCVNNCRMGPGEMGFCGLRENLSGKLHSRAGTARLGIWTAYYDALPTNCVAHWVCPGCSHIGYPEYSSRRGPERGYDNLAVFLSACSFDCAFCQNWSFRDNVEALSPLKTPGELADMVNERTSCICFFGGDPSPQMPFSLAAARRALAAAEGRILRICWETNGSMHPGLLKRAADISLETGGCIKFDLKAHDDRIHRALTGSTNTRTLENIALAARLMRERPSPPPLVVSTLLVPGYVGPGEVSAIARFLASVDPDIPYSLLAFHPDFLMDDMGTTKASWAMECAAAAKDAGLKQVRIGNEHLLS
jgi:pyruvate formate lyase activating enzyme